MDISEILPRECRPGRTIYDYHENQLLTCLKLTGKESVYILKSILKNLTDLKDVSIALQDIGNGYTFLGAACCTGRYDLVEEVINHVTEIRQMRDDIEANRVLYVPRQSVLDIYDDHGYTPLLYSIICDHLDICKLLIQADVDVNLQQQMNKQTPLLTAIENSKDDIVTLLLENLANVQICDNVGLTPLYMAIKNSKENIVKQLIQADCDVDVGSQDHAPIFLATRTGQLNIVKLLCAAGCQKDISNKYGVTPVYEASMKGHTDILKYLLDNECSPNSVDMYDQSPLHVAVLWNHLHCVQLLVEAGANWKLRNHHRESALDLALQKGRADIVKYFLEEGLDVLPRNSTSGLKNLSTIFENGHSSTLTILLQGCAKLPMLHCIGMIPMFSDQLYMMKLLLLSGIQTVPAKLMSPDTHQCKETSDWLIDFKANPRRLQDICRIRIRRCLGNKVFFKVKSLPLPVELKSFICLKKL
ncbi:hypothetical protein ACF0H5_006404 [Mactra antiquata]